MNYLKYNILYLYYTLQGLPSPSISEYKRDVHLCGAEGIEQEYTNLSSVWNSRRLPQEQFPAGICRPPAAPAGACRHVLSLLQALQETAGDCRVHKI